MHASSLRCAQMREREAPLHSEPLLPNLLANPRRLGWHTELSRRHTLGTCGMHTSSLRCVSTRLREAQAAREMGRLRVGSTRRELHRDSARGSLQEGNRVTARAVVASPMSAVYTHLLRGGFWVREQVRERGRGSGPEVLGAEVRGRGAGRAPRGACAAPLGVSRSVQSCADCHHPRAPRSPRRCGAATTRSGPTTSRRRANPRAGRSTATRRSRSRSTTPST